MQTTRLLKPFACASLALTVIASGLTLGGTAATAVPEPSGSTATPRVTGGVNNFRVTQSEQGLVISADPFCNGLYRSCNAWIEFPGYSQKNVDPRGGHSVGWPSAWQPGTAGTVSIRYYAIDIVGNGWYGTPPLTTTVTRPEEFTALTATAGVVDQGARSVSVSGAATKGAQIRLRGQQVATSNGQWSTTANGLSVGRNDLTFEQWVGGVYRDSRTVAVTVDPPQATLTASGSFPSDISQRARISGVGAKGATIVIRSGGAEVGRVQAISADGSYVWDAPAPLAGGPRAYSVSQIVGGTEAGNVPVSLDYGTAVSITSHEDQAAADAGATTFAGRGEDGSRVRVSVNGTDLPETTVENGVWSVTGVLVAGEHTVAVTQMSKGANTTGVTVTLNPGATEVELSAAGRFDAEDETKAAEAFGSAPTGSIVVLRNSLGQEIGRATASGDEYVITIDPAQATSGVNAFTVVIDGAESEVRSFTLDYGLPAARVVVTTPAENGTVAPGRVAFGGTGEAGARIIVRGSSREIATTRVGADGAWSATSTTELPAGAYVLYFDQVVRGGITSTVRHAFTVGEAPIAPFTVTSPGPDEVLDTLTPEFRGTGHEGATITARGSSRVIGSGTVQNGQWLVQTDSSAPLAPGSYNLYVDQSIGGTVVATVRVAFTVSNEAFRELTLSAPAQNEVVTTLRPTFVGTATPGAEIRVGSSRTTVATATVARDGTWRATADFDLERGGTYTGLEVKQTTPSGKTSTVSSSFTVARGAE